MNSNDFWGRFLWNTVILYLCGGLAILSIVLIRADRVSLYEFQHDLFAALLGQETMYNRNDAQEIADVLRKIPTERLDEDFSYMAMIAMERTSEEKKETKQTLIIAHPSRMEDIVLYADMIESWSENSGLDWQDTVGNQKMREVIKKMLQGEKTPPLDLKLPWQPFTFASLGGSLFIVAVLTQFVSFGFYSLVCVCQNDNPLDLPKGAGSKIAMLITLPGSPPIMLLILLLFSVGGIFKKKISSRSSHQQHSPSSELRSLSDKAAERSRKSLERIRRQLEGDDSGKA